MGTSRDPKNLTRIHKESSERKLTSRPRSTNTERESNQARRPFNKNKPKLPRSWNSSPTKSRRADPESLNSRNKLRTAPSRPPWPEQPSPLSPPSNRHSTHPPSKLREPISQRLRAPLRRSRLSLREPRTR